MAADDLLVPAHRGGGPAAGPRHRADVALQRASRRDGTVVTPDTMASHMDHTDTVVIPRHAVTAADPRAVDPDSTVVLPAVRRR